MYLKRISAVFCLVFLVQCSSSSSGSGGTTTTTTTEEDDLATFVDWSGYTWDSLSLLIDDSKTLDSALPIECAGGGTIEEGDNGIDINDCVDTIDSASYLTRGSYSVTESTGLVTHEWDQDVLVDDDEIFSTTGSISFDTSSDGLIAFDFSATFESGVYQITGIVSDNSDGTTDLSITCSLDGEVWLDCTYEDADLSSLTQETIDAGCEDDDESCTTLDCSNDFQCQLFAEDDQTDEFETSNSRCVDGCCAVVSEESDCDSSTVSCTTDFECQQFADEDQTDEFETNNVECASDGCCAVTD